ncbi:MAG: hypothetical protein ABEH43_06460, partial [Flavobacteriales bacterium]
MLNRVFRLIGVLVYVKNATFELMEANIEIPTEIFTILRFLFGVGALVFIVLFVRQFILNRRVKKKERKFAV